MPAQMIGLPTTWRKPAQVAALVDRSSEPIWFVPIARIVLPIGPSANIRKSRVYVLVSRVAGEAIWIPTGSGTRISNLTKAFYLEKKVSPRKKDALQLLDQWRQVAGGPSDERRNSRLEQLSLTARSEAYYWLSGSGA